MKKDTELRVGEISYANCFNIFHYLRRQFPVPGVSFVAAPPAELNSRLRRGLIDLSPSSSIEYARHADDYYLLPRYCIGSRGPIWSIRLFSRLPVEDLDGSTVVLTGESDTTVVLLRIILSRFYGFTNRFVTEYTDLEEALSKAPAVLLIGDKALAGGTRAPAGVRVYELSELWQAHTGLPFVFALWTLRRDAARARAEQLGAFWRALESAHQRIASPDDELVEAALASRSFLDREMILEYWRLVCYELTPEHLRGLTEFYRLAVEIGQAKSTPRLEFYDPEKNY